MGTYYAAVDNEQKKYFEAPNSFSNKYPGICNPLNPFSCMVVMKNAQGYCFEIENDAGYNCYYDKEYENITEEVYSEFLTIFPWAKDHYEENHDR